MRPFAIALCSLVAGPAAGEFSLELPIDCRLDETCYIQQFVDHDPTSDAIDFQCGKLSYDGHKGTDFALPSLAAQAEGVAVLAAASGTVVGVRDGMADQLQISDDAPDVSDRECGNGVVIRHEEGWETQYCHLAEGSVAVTQNQTVAAGDTLGMVGLSGQTQFPHLHLSVRKRGEVTDPFAPDGVQECGRPNTETLWNTPIATPAGGLVTSGFSADVPQFETIKAGNAHVTDLTPTDPIVVWGYIFGGQPGDNIILSFQAPDGETSNETIALERTQAQLFRAWGRRAPAGGWMSGNYTGTVTHMRDGIILDQQTSQTTVTSQ